MSHERAILFDCAGEELVGIVAVPHTLPVAETGVLIIVGGPQYRAGSHRSFVFVSRHLALNGIACMRFDYRGMGDSTGESRSFDEIDQDVRAALDTFFRAVPALRRVVLWGLCDGASAACLYDPQDARVVGVIALNPWIRTEVGEAKTRLRHYYREKLLDRDFWRRLMALEVRITESARNVAVTLTRSRGWVGSNGDSGCSLSQRMAQALVGAARAFALVLSGRDPVAQEFVDLGLPDRSWQAACRDLHRATLSIEDANHTFSNAEWRLRVASFSTEVLLRLGQR